MIFNVPGWSLTTFTLFVELMGILTIVLIMVYIILSSRGSTD